MEDWRHPVFAIAECLRDHVGDSDNPVNAVSDAEAFLDLLEEDDYEQLRAGDLPANQYATVKSIQGTSTLVFDPETIPRQVLLQVRDEFETVYENLNGFALEDRGGIAEAIKTEGSGGTLDDIYTNYKDKIPHRFLPVLKDALVLRIADRNQDLSRGRVYDLRGEIAGSHSQRGHDPQEAQNLISLCSTGYLDDDRFFNTMYTEQVEHGSLTDTEYKGIFDTYVRDKPFTVFVRADGMTHQDVYTLALDKSLKIDDYTASPDYIDICGKGETTHAVIDRTLEEFQGNHSNLRQDTATRDEIDQYILRIDHGSL